MRSAVGPRDMSRFPARWCLDWVRRTTYDVLYTAGTECAACWPWDEMRGICGNGMGGNDGQARHAEP